jgi:hypothetical protein
MQRDGRGREWGAVLCCAFRRKVKVGMGRRGSRRG